MSPRTASKNIATTPCELDATYILYLDIRKLTAKTSEQRTGRISHIQGMGNPMANDTYDQKDLASNFAQILGEPALLGNEDQSSYVKLRALVRQEIEPKSIFN